MDAFEPVNDYHESGRAPQDPLSLRMTIHKIQTTATSRIMAHATLRSELGPLETIIQIFDVQMKALWVRLQTDYGA